MSDLNLEELMRAAGASLGDAQGRLLTGVDAPPTTMAIAEATLDMKVTIDGAKGGSLQVAPVSAADARNAAINPAALSSVTMRFVAFGNDLPSQTATPRNPAPTGGATPGDSPTAPPPTRRPIDRGAAELALRARPDIAARLNAGEDIKFASVAVGGDDDKRFIVTARAATGGSIAAAVFVAKD